MWSEGARSPRSSPAAPRREVGGGRASRHRVGRAAGTQLGPTGCAALEGKAVGSLALYVLRYGARESWGLPIVLGGRGGGHSGRPELGALLRACARIGELARRELQPGELGPDVGSARLQRKRRADRV